MTGNDHPERTSQLSDFLDGSLDGREHALLEAHLADCGACRATLEDLRDVVARARGLGPLTPGRDLWPGVAAAIAAPVAAKAGDVIALPIARTPRPSLPTRGIALTGPQLAAAAVILVLTSVGITSWVGPGINATDGSAQPGTTMPAVAAVAAVAPRAAQPPELAGELASLEAMLRDAAEALDPETVRVLEANLAVIERAIDDSRAALTQDPENAFLAEHLDRVYRRKLTYLRQAVRVSEWSG